MKNKIATFLLFSITMGAIPLVCAEEAAFNLFGVIDNIISFQNETKEKTVNENFVYASNNLYNGNVVVAYNEFEKVVNEVDKNVALLTLSKRMYELGFFSLGDMALSKIQGEIDPQKQELKRAYGTNYKLSKDEEQYLTKIYTSIFYNNSPEEAAFNLIKKTVLLENSDYADYIMAQSLFECKQYNQALIYVNKAIEKNQTNSNYKVFKAKTLIAFGKYKEAVKFINENKNTISIYFDKNLRILEQQAKLNLAKTDEDKKFYQIYSYYLDGNYYKVLSETKNILNFYKNNPKILTLQGMANLASGKIEEAKADFSASYKINKKFDLTLMGMADCEFIKGNYKKAYQGYKNLINTDLKNEAIMKAALSLEKINPNDKKLVKLNKQKETFEKRSYFEYYLIANNLIQDEEEKKQFVAKSLNINFLNKDIWDVMFNLDYKNKDFDKMENIVFNLMFLDDINAEYYYYLALVLNHKNNKKEAFYEVKKAVNLNPDFTPAVELMNKLQNELI